MMFPHFNRRLHLYLALSLLPWFVMYGLSSAVFSHTQYFNDRDEAKGVPLWTKRLEQPYETAVPSDGNLRPLATKVFQDFHLAGAYGAYRPPGGKHIEIYASTFLHATRARYYFDEKRLTVEDRRFRMDQFLTGMHTRGGFRQDAFLQTLWSVLVDVVCVGMLLWIATGIYMWWTLPGVRRWGWVALSAGVISFGLFLMRL
jgi:hypothetical protein